MTLSGCNKKIVFEIKDIGSISTSKIQDTLKEAMDNREASYGVLVVKYIDSLPKSVGSFQEFGNNMLACGLCATDGDVNDELLKIAYKWSQSRTLSQNLTSSQVNAEFIESEIDSIRQKIDKFRKIKADCTNIEKSSKNIRSTTETLADEINTELDNMNKSLEIKK